MIKAYKAKLKGLNNEYKYCAWALAACSQTSYNDGAGVVPKATAEVFALWKPTNPEEWILKSRFLEANRSDVGRIYPVSENAKSLIDSTLFAPAINWENIAIDILQQLLNEMTGQTKIDLEEVSTGFAAVYLASAKRPDDAGSVLDLIKHSAKLAEFRELTEQFLPVTNNFVLEEGVCDLFSRPSPQGLFSGQDWN